MTNVSPVWITGKVNTLVLHQRGVRLGHDRGLLCEETEANEKNDSAHCPLSPSNSAAT